MATASRVYVIFDDGKALALVRASSQAAAIRHVLKDRFEAVPADQDALIKHLPTLPVQDAGAAE